ncbi:hypothetical protein K505DRAFT_417731 [Melanomma pulvis-pyrius CBS 109.77]|uniref:Geranylgeranyl pyrophosphate synthetase n=1 Tax=Melanomma pulvis-pyrius CBS 109.77 TaxID=1314802 RepID=A0A6A6XAU8_9PLEO|nr:hypothetical protein K505DRAFT_417731 [Melanomma pulvis-pyrius CBS 109.77]
MSNSRGGWGSSQPFTANARGDYAPRGGRGRGGRGYRGGRGASSAKYTPPPKPDIVKHPLGELLQTLQVSELDPETEKLSDAVKITDLKYVASYNWMNDKTPTIMVPGNPPAWTPVKEAQRLKEDNGQYFRDPNGARYPRYPTEPAVQAVLTSQPAFPTSDIDIFACGSTMGNLLRFVRSSSKAFRFSIEVVGNTLFFIRKENSPKELIEDVRGFGHSFPEAYTTWEKEVKGSESHQRLVQYDFGGFNCLMRFECDGYLKDMETSVDTQNHTLHELSNGHNLSKAFEAASVSHTLSDVDEPLYVKEGGFEVPQRSIFDLKTRSGKYKTEIDMSDILPVLWLKQIPNFIIAYHDGAGLFQNIKVRDIVKDVQAWEQENASAIKRLAVLLSKLTKIAKGDKRGLLEVYCPSDRLEIRRQYGDGSNSLPFSLRDQWEGSSGQPTYLSDSDDGEGKIPHHGGYSFSYNDSDDDEPKDLTGCSDSCGYCGSCSY